MYNSPYELQDLSAFVGIKSVLFNLVLHKNSTALNLIPPHVPVAVEYEGQSWGESGDNRRQGTLSAEDFKSFGNDDDAPSLSEEPLLAPAGSDDINDFQLPTMEEPSATLPEKNISSEIMTDTQKTLDNLKKEWAEMDNRNTSPFVQETNIEKKDDLDEENFAYPFGGWTDEKNYQKRS